jgi:hypothetical protein
MSRQRSWTQSPRASSWWISLVSRLPIYNYTMVLRLSLHEPLYNSWLSLPFKHSAFTFPWSILFSNYYKVEVKSSLEVVGKLTLLDKPYGTVGTSMVSSSDKGDLELPGRLKINDT